MKSKCSFILKASTALVLALLMLFGTVATSFAKTVDLADTGHWWTGGDYRLIGAFNSWAWDSNYLTLAESPSGTYKGHMYLYGSASTSNFNFAYLNRNDSGTRFNPYGNSDYKLTAGTDYGTDGPQDGKCFYFDRNTQLGSSATTLYDVTFQIVANQSKPNVRWSKTTVAAISPSASTDKDAYETNETVTITGGYTGTKIGNLSYTYAYKKSTDANYTNLGSTRTFTPTTAGTYTVRVTATDDGIHTSGDGTTNGTAARTAETATKSITVTAPACTPALQTASGSDLGASQTIYSHQTLKFKTNDPSSHAATYTVTKNGSTVTASNYLSESSSVTNNTTVTFTPDTITPGGSNVTYVITSSCTGGGSDSVTVTVKEPANVTFKYSTNSGTISGGGDGTATGMTYDSAASITLGGKDAHVVYSLKDFSFSGTSAYYWAIWNGSANKAYNTAITSSTANAKLGDTGISMVALSSSLKTITPSGSKDHYNLYYDIMTDKFYIEYPVKVTYKYTTDKSTSTEKTSEYIAYNTTASTKDCSVTGYTPTSGNTWYNEVGCTSTFNFSTALTANKTLYTPLTANEWTITLDANTNGGTIKKTSSSSAANTATFTHTYGTAETIASQYYSVTPPTGYTLDGWYDKASGGTKYTSVTSTQNAAKTYYAHYTEVKAGATVKAYTDGSASGTGGTVKVGASGTAGATATISGNSSFGIDTASPAIIKASTAAGYEFKGWQFNSTHLKYSFDGTTYTVVASTSTTYGTSSDTTVYVKTDGTSGMTTGNTEIHAMFESAKYTITDNGAYHKTGAAGYVSGTTGGTFTVSQTGSLSYDTNLTLTATAASGYAVEGVYWSTDGSSWTRVTTSNTTSNGYVTAATNNTFKVTDNFRLKAQFVQLKKLSAFDSYEMKNSQVIFVTAPPKSITIKHTDAHGDVTTYTYSYDGTKTKGNPDSPDGSKPAALAIGTGTYGQGNYIQFFAGDEITMTYSAMASSELLKGVFYNNSANFYVNKPTTAQFVAHTYDNTHAIYMNSAYYASVPSGLPTTTVDQDAHSIKFTGTQDYKNIDVEIGTKRKVYFSDYTNAVIHSKNMDDYYYDNEALSVTGDQLTVKAAGSATQTNTITASSVGFYYSNADGSKGAAVPAADISTYHLSAAYDSGSGAISNSGTTDSTRYIIISGNMPAYDLYIDLGISSSYTLKAASKIMSDPDSSVLYLKQKASTVTVGSLSAPSNAYVSPSTTTCAVGGSITLTASGLTSGYMFIGWYWGNSDNSAPDYAKGFISEKTTFSYKPKKGGTIWAVGTKELFINGSKYITGKASDWYSENGSWKNQKMSFDPSRGTKGSYYWEITDTMFASAGSNFKTWNDNKANTTYGSYFKGDDKNFYWANNDDSYHGKAFFQFLDTETGSDNKGIWYQVLSFEESQEGATYGKIYPQGDDYDWKRNNGQGFINFNETDYPGYSSPIRIYLDADTKDLDVRPTPIYCDIYVSNGYDVGSTLKSDAVTVEPVVDGVVKTSGQTGYFDVNAGTVYTPDAEGNVTKYSPKKKGATVRITKQARGSDKIAAFLIYDLDAKTVRAEKNITKGTAVSGKTPYYADITLSSEKQRLYICPIVEESGAKVTVTFDATQLNRAQWGDIVTAYAWYKSTNGPAIGAYPGQPMIPSDDMSTWTTSFNPVKSGNEVAGITFSNYVDGKHSWLGCTTDNGGVPSGGTNVMGTVSYGGSGTAASPTTVSIADDGLIKQYNYIESGTNKEYSRANYKAQTYDYHEPVALYDRYKNEESIDITFQMKDGNSSLISWRHSNLILENQIDTGENILNLPSGWTPLRWEYLTNAKGDKYVDMNGSEIDTKPTASFYVASKGLVVYQGSKMNYVFHGGHDYEMKDYTGTYSNGSYSRSALSFWSSDITYGGTANLDMKYAVQWYVYDAQGNYVTTVLSAGIADLASGTTDTYIAKQLEDMGYAVDGKSVAICYDKPRYMYGDWTVTNSANNINSGTDFDAYRFEGQWIANASTAMTRVNVEVAMMTDSGEVLAGSNVAGYGSATANWASGVTFTKTHTLAGDKSWAETATSEAKLNGIELTATSQNFIGWYYYDANTNEFTKATYKEATGFRPSYSTKDITFYAVYRASAIYEFVYTGRQGSRTYSVAGNDLTAAEMEAGANQNKVQYANHSADILSKIPVGIGIFKKDIVFSSTTVGNSTKDNSDEYILRMSGFTPTLPTYTLTATYKNANGDLVNISDSEVYNAKAIDLTSGSYTDSASQSKPAGTAVTTYYGKQFLGWYAYDGGAVGDLLSTQANYGLRLTRDQAIIAVYDENNAALPTDGWTAHIDENVVNKELTTSDSGEFYNDTIVRVRNSADVRATLPDNFKIGVLVVVKNSGTKAPNSYSTDNLNKLVASIPSGQTMTAKSGLMITNMQAETQTTFNRTDIAVKSDYKTTNGKEYCVYAYFYDGSSYHFSAASAVKTYE